MSKIEFLLKRVTEMYHKNMQINIESIKDPKVPHYDTISKLFGKLNDLSQAQTDLEISKTRNEILRQKLEELEKLQDDLEE